MPGSKEKLYLAYIQNGSKNGYISISNIKNVNSTSNSSSENNSSSQSSSASTATSTNNNNNQSTSTSSVTSDTKSTVSNTNSSSQSSIVSQAQAAAEKKFENDKITTPQEFDSVNWEKFDDGSNYLLNLTNGRDIYYSFIGNDPYLKYWQEAINAWNALGVIHFVPYNNESNVTVIKLGTSTNDIVPYFPSVPQGNWLGATLRDKTSDDKVTDIVGYLNKDTMQNSNDYENLINAEHELGHTLGFDHDASSYGQQGYFLTMAPESHNLSQSYLDLPIGAKEQYALEKYYNLSVMPGYYNYPVINANVKSLNSSDSSQNKVLDFSN